MIHRLPDTVCRARRLMMAGAGALVLGLGVLASLVMDHFGLVGPVMLALVNLALVILAVFQFARPTALAWSPVLSFLPGVAVSSSVTTVYFAIFSPDVGASDILGGRRLDHAEFVQIAVFVFLCAYLTPLLFDRLLARPRRVSTVLHHSTNSATFHAGVVIAGVGGVTAGWIAALPGIPAEIAFSLAAARNYLSPLIFVAGYRLRTSPRWVQGLTFWGLASAFLVHTVANSRGYALWPVVLLLAGLALSPRTSASSVRRVALAVLVAFPVYMVMANQTRSALGTVGLTDFSERAEILRRAVSGGGIETGDESSLDMVMGRLFSVGGRTLIENNWESRPSDRFQAGAFMKEAIVTLWPRFLGGMDPWDARYSGPVLLRQYGFMISEEVSVEVSMIGHLVYLGGMWGLVIGGLTVGVLHLLLSRALSSKAAGHGVKLALTAGVVSTNAWAYNLDIVSYVRSLLWTMIYISIVCALLRLLLRQGASGKLSVAA